LCGGDSLLVHAAVVARVEAAARREEGDHSTVAAGLAEQVKALGASLVAMATEEVAELVACMPAGVDLVSADFAYAAKATDLAKADADLMEKAGKRNSTGDAAKLQAMHDMSAALGATCDTTAKVASDDDIAKAATEATRLTDVVAKATAALDDMVEKVGAMQGRIDELEGKTAPAKGVVAVPPGLTAISKAADLGGDDSLDAAFGKEDVKKYLDSLPEAERGQVLLKISLGQPFRIGR